MANEKRLIYLEDAIALLECDIADSKASLITAYHGDKETIRSEMNGVRAAISILKNHAKVCGTVDAVEVTRCKDCKHWADGVHGCTDHVKVCKIGFYMVGENGYCVYGERKDNDRERSY